MGWRTLTIVIAATVGCGGSVVTTSDGGGSGSCTGDDGGWTCTALDDAPDCPQIITSPPPGAEAACPITITMGTTNPAMPPRFTITECFACGSKGSGTPWSCDPSKSSRWQAGATFSCSP